MPASADAIMSNKVQDGIPVVLVDTWEWRFRNLGKETANEVEAIPHRARRMATRSLLPVGWFWVLQDHAGIVVRKVDFPTTNSPSPHRTLDLESDIGFHDGNAEETIVNKAAEDLFAKVQPTPNFADSRQISNMPIHKIFRIFVDSFTNSLAQYQKEDDAILVCT